MPNNQQWQTAFFVFLIRWAPPDFATILGSILLEFFIFFHHLWRPDGSFELDTSKRKR
jgi:hypothetical protein